MFALKLFVNSSLKANRKIFLSLDLVPSEIVTLAGVGTLVTKFVAHVLKQISMAVLIQ